MTAIGLAVSDSRTMLRRNLRHMQRYPSLTVMLIAMPIVFLLLFVFVLGGTMGAGLPGARAGATAGRAEYLAYVVPGILIIAIAAAAQGTAISVATDMTGGIIDRFRTMAISRAAVLTGHVIGALIQTMLCLALVLGLSLAIGFRPTAGAVEWLATVGLLVLVTVSMTWLCVALGLTAKSVETASNSPMPLLLLPFFGSGFVPSDTMPAGLRWFAEHQPFTPVIESLRGLLLGSPIGNSAWIAVAWCVAIGGMGYLRSRSAYDRHAVR